jgi:hypothetical protein
VEHSEYPGKNTKVQHLNTFWHKNNFLRMHIQNTSKYIQYFPTYSARVIYTKKICIRKTMNMRGLR